eukprot:155144-Amphidinium_carterae.1
MHRKLVPSKLDTSKVEARQRRPVNTAPIFTWAVHGYACVCMWHDAQFGIATVAKLIVKFAGGEPKTVRSSHGPVNASIPLECKSMAERPQVERGSQKELPQPIWQVVGTGTCIRVTTGVMGAPVATTEGRRDLLPLRSNLGTPLHNMALNMPRDPMDGGCAALQSREAAL